MVPDIYQAANVHYIAVHFPVMVAFLLWGFFARPREPYVWARNLLIVQTSLALPTHIAFPLAPPRMFPEWGFIHRILDGMAATALLCFGLLLFFGPHYRSRGGQPVMTDTASVQPETKTASAGR